MSEPSDAELVREAASEVPRFFKDTVLLAAVPSLLLGVGAVLDAWVSPLHSVAPAVVGVLKGVGFGLYFKATMRGSGGVEGASPVTAIVLLTLAFVAVEYGDWALLVPVVVWLLPLIDFTGLYGDGPEKAVGGVIDTVKAAALLWFGGMFILLLALVMLSLVLSLPVSLYSTYADREGAWLASLVGGVLVGPLVHAALLFRFRLLLAIHGDPE
jgi:hypothetical protein